MRKVFFCTLLISLVLSSCEKKENNIPIFSFSLLKDSIENFKLNISKKESIVGFDYLHKNDTISRLYLQYNKKNDVLISKFDTFHSNKKTHIYKKIKFKIYQIEMVLLRI